MESESIKLCAGDRRLIALECIKWAGRQSEFKNAYNDADESLIGVE